MLFLGVEITPEIIKDIMDARAEFTMCKDIETEHTNLTGGLNDEQQQ